MYKFFLSLFVLLFAGLFAQDEKVSVYNKLIDDTSIPVILTPKERAILSSNIVSSVTVVLKQMGESFSTGEPLIILNDAIASAAKKRAEAILARAKVLYNTKERLFNDQVSSLIELADAKATLGVANADLDIAEKGERDTIITAPYHGEVEELYIHDGESVEVGSRLIAIFNDDVLLTKMLLPFEYLKSIRLGQNIHIHLLEVDQTIDAKVSYIGEVLDPASNTFKVFGQIENQEHLLRAGMSGVLQYKIPIPTFSFGVIDARRK